MPDPIDNNQTTTTTAATVTPSTTDTQTAATTNQPSTSTAQITSTTSTEGNTTSISAAEGQTAQVTAKEEPSVSLADFTSILDGVPSAIPPVASAKKEDSGKTKDDGKAVTQQTTQVTPNATVQTAQQQNGNTTQQTTTQTQQPDGRDYSGLSEQEVSLFKKMSNESFNTLLPIFKEHKTFKTTLAQKDQEIAQLKQGKQQLPDNYYQHKDAYLLTPEFQENSQLLNQANMYKDYWQEQLLAIEKGQDWHPLVQGQDGRWYKGEKVAATPEGKLMVWNNLQHVTRQVGEIQGRNNVLAQNHISRYEQDIGKVKADVEQHFGYFDKPENVGWKPHLDNIRNMIPTSLRNHPMAEWGVRATVALMSLRQAYDAEKAKNTQTQNIQTTLTQMQQQAGPSNSTVTSQGNSSKEAPAVSMKDFEALLH